MDAPLACRTLGWLRRNPMLWSALDPIPTNSMLWPSLRHHMHGLPEAIPRVWENFNLVLLLAHSDILAWLRKDFQKTAILIATSDQQAMAVGRTVAQWAYYEHLLNCFLIDLLKLPEAQGIRKSIRMTFGKRMESWRELAQRSHTTEHGDEIGSNTPYVCRQTASCRNIPRHDQQAIVP
jgi:hypothetical protein